MGDSSLESQVELTEKRVMLQTPHSDNLYRKVYQNPIYQKPIHQKPIYQKQRTTRSTKTQNSTHLEQVETNLNQKINKIRHLFLKKLNHHFCEIKKIEECGSDRVLDKFLHKLSYDFDNKIALIEEAQETRIYSTRANIEDYPFLTKFRDDFDKIKINEFSGAFFHKDWVDVESGKKYENEWRKIESKNSKAEDVSEDLFEFFESRESFYEKFCMIVDENRIGKVNSVSSVNSRRILGKIKFFVKKAGYGIIEGDVEPNQDYYFNVRNAEKNQCFKAGQRVVFDSFEKKKKKNPRFDNKEAENVRILYV